MAKRISGKEEKPQIVAKAILRSKELPGQKAGLNTLPKPVLRQLEIEIEVSLEKSNMKEENEHV